MNIYIITSLKDNSLKWKAYEEEMKIFEYNQKEVDLTDFQKKLIFCLLNSEDNKASYENLYASLYPNGEFTVRKDIISHINKIKQHKSNTTCKFGALIENCRNEGYSLAAKVEKVTLKNDYIIKKLLPIGYNFINNESESFYGREWLIAELKERLDKTKDSIIVIHGAPGVGKTSFIKYLKSKEDNILCAIDCESSPEIKNLESLIRLLIYYMCEKESSYAEEIHKILQADDSCLSSIYDTTKNLLIDPLSKYNISGKKPIIIIDSLDKFDKKNTNGHIENGLLNAIKRNEIIKDFLNELKKYFRLIVAFNTSPHLNDYFEKYHQIKIDTIDTRHINDIREFLYRELKPDKDRDKKIEEIIKRSEGSFLYTRLIVDERKDNEGDIKDYPHGLDTFFLESFEKAFSKRPDEEYENRFVLPLTILASFPEGVPCRTLSHACKWNKRSKLKFLRDFPYYVKKSDDSFETIKIIYRSLISWLFTEKAQLYCLGDADILRAKQSLVKGCFIQIEKNNLDGLYDFELFQFFTLLYDDSIWKNNLKFQMNIKNTVKKEIMVVPENKDYFYNKLIKWIKEAINEYKYSLCEIYVKIMEDLFEIIEKTDNLKIYIHLLEGKLAEHNGMLKDAKKEYEQGIYIYITTQNKNEIDYDIIFDMYSSLAFCLYRLTDYSKAINTYKTLLDFTNSSEKSTLTQLIDTKIDLANVFRIIGDYSQALTIFKQLDKDPYKKELILNPRLQYKKLLHEAWTKRNTMANDSVLELYEKANNLYENNSECICKNDLAKFQNNIALVYMVKKEFEDAHAKIDDAIKLYSKIHGEDSLPISDFYITQGDIYKEEAVAEFKSNPSKIDEAKKHFKAARDSYDKANKIRILKYEYNVNNSKDIDVENDNYNLNLIVSLIRLARLEILQIKLMPDIYKKNDYEIKVEYIKGLIIQVREINDNNNNKNETSRKFYKKIIKETEERFEEL